MKGLYRYVDKDGGMQFTRDTDNIPKDATHLLDFHPPPIPAPPHTDADHEFIKSIGEEFERVFERVYGYKPPEKHDAADQQTG